MHAYYDKPVHRHSHPSPATTTKKVPVELKNKRKRREKWRPAATLLPLLTYNSPTETWLLGVVC